ncbi:targeting protein for Xklp2 [Planoprotostelium fungivorum]|uniref:Targeting protein for Xklp2 n=1 Tax=Planoprotostelium fungivorum TaxID=1890364 RepID=A0A2P6NDZ1_9EUKA|nr:targeting protein for Xklp2 [Planoprotostelium fungivorum]
MASVEYDIDPTYEFFDAPKEVDFLELVKEQGDNGSDRWFDEQKRMQNGDMDTEAFIRQEMEDDDRQDQLMSTLYPESVHSNAYFNQTMGLSEAPSDLSDDHRELDETTYSTKHQRVRHLTKPITPKFHTSRRANRVPASANETSSARPGRPILNWTSKKLTVPQEPRFRVDERLSTRRTAVESSEEKELRLIEEDIRRLQEQKIKAKETAERLAATKVIPQQAPLTTPVQFSFATDHRMMRFQTQVEPEYPTSKRARREHSGPTVAQPFNFHESSRPKEQPQETFTFAESLHKFNKGARQERNRQSVANRMKREMYEKPQGATKPQPFHFEVDERLAFKVKEPYVTTQEREEEEALNAPKFKARPFDRRIVESRGTIGVKQVSRPTPTAAEPFHFLTSKNDIAEEEKEQPPSSKKRERPLPLGPTIPESPALATRSRAQQFDLTHQGPQEETVTFKAKPAPAFKFFIPQHNDIPITRPADFQLSTDARGEQHQLKLKMKLEEERQKEEELRNFKAKNMQVVDEPFRPAHQRIHTESQPFNLYTEERRIKAEADFARQVQQMQEEERIKREFKSKPFVDVAVFQPVRPDRPLLEVNEFQLNSESRAFKRRQFDEAIQQKEAESEFRKRLREQKKQEEDERQLREYRKTLNHKPIPIAKSRPVMIKFSETNPTTPKSPMLATKNRSMLHVNRDL